MNNLKELIDIFNKYEVQEDDANAIAIASELGFEVDGKQWAVLKKKPARVIIPMGISAYKAFSTFLFMYKKRYRMNLVAKAFYALTDNEIADMFVELPYFVSNFYESTEFMPSAENFLKEKLWAENYPNRPAGERRRRIENTANDWETYIASLSMDMREAVEVYRDNGMLFSDFKAQINAG